MLRAAVEVVLHLGLVAVDVARLPEAVAPFGQHRRQPGAAQMAAQAGGGRRLGEQLDVQRAGRAARRHRRALGAEVEAHPVAVAADVDGVAARGLQPGHRRVVALRDPADRRACPPGSRARCRRGRRRAGSRARRGRRAARGARRGRRSAPRRRASQSSAWRSGAPSTTSSSRTLSANGSVIRSRPRRPLSKRSARSAPSASGSASVADTTCSAISSSSAAMTPSVNWMNWSAIAPSAHQIPRRRTSRRPDRRTSIANGRRLSSMRTGPRDSTRPSATVAV